MNTTMNDTQTIVIAWTAMTGLRPTGRMIRFDGYNYKPEHVPCLEPHACVWLNAGTAEDVAKATAHAENIRHEDGFRDPRVICYPTTERNPLERARKEIMARA